MTIHTHGKPWAVAAAMVAGTLVATPAAGQDFPERLSFMEKPMATEIGDVTLLLSGFLDTMATYDVSVEHAIDAGLVGNLQIGALTQLPNRLRVELDYSGYYASDDVFHAELDQGYTDNTTLSVSGAWGTVLAGNVSDVVREQTRRQRGAGNAFLAFDNALGELGEWGGGYVGRFGPWVFSGVVDGEGHVDLGAMVQRPAGTRDYRLTFRATTGDFTAADSSSFDTTALALVSEFIYGSSLFDIGVGCEWFSSKGPDANRCHVSSGVSTKVGVVTLSIEGHVGRIEGHDEISIALGAQYDVARGLSANFGLNHARSKTIIDGVRFTDTNETSIISSLRYAF
ncbi:MAG: hypothetical protein F4Z10_04060 [Synechococcus sp. SB0666_bin_14]|nr:hypothetical protein [Synechococcus sp. SB0666_bin_14]MYA91706.1 hypothetical protein [Synechococcus sp. SB0663_bin_10]MYG47556.1 hypothetical protein [Synechococcus sp. SB0675_bin_6]MYJ59272.1 hypothetical protein [Synechococcus sp. SB0672_bin_6]MYK90971.1 hypothetical protein [Synechococcus sp. SB0669_bin_8]